MLFGHNIANNLKKQTTEQRPDIINGPQKNRTTEGAERVKP